MNFKNFIPYIVVIFVFLLFILGYRIFSFNLTFAAIFIAVLLGILAAFELLRSSQGLIIIGLFLSVVVVLPRVWPLEDVEKQREIREIDKNLFALGIGLGILDARVIARFPGDAIFPCDSFIVAVSGLLEIFEYPHNEKEEYVSGLAGILKKIDTLSITMPLGDTNLELTKRILSELVKLNEPLEKFIVKRWDSKGIGIFKLGLNIPIIQRNLWQLEMLNRFQDDGKLSPEDLEWMAHLDVNTLFKPHLDVFRRLATEDYFADNLRRSINFIATANIFSSSDREEMMEQLVSIGFTFGMPLPKEPAVVTQLSQGGTSSSDVSNQKDRIQMKVDTLDISSIEVLLSKKEYPVTISKLKNLLQQEPNNAEAHFLLAKARCLSTIELKRKHPDGIMGGFPSLICKELEIYLDLAPNGSYVQKARSLLEVLECHHQHSWSDPPKDGLEAVKKRLFEDLVVANLKHFTW